MYEVIALEDVSSGTGRTREAGGEDHALEAIGYLHTAKLC